MKRMMILLLAAALLVGTTGCNRPGTASTDTSVVSGGGGSGANSSVTESVQSAPTSKVTRSMQTSSKQQTSSRITSSKVSSKVSSKKDTSSQTRSFEPLVIPKPLQAFWDSLTTVISEEEKKDYKAYMDEKGYQYDGIDDKDLFKVAYGLDEKPYFVIAFAANGDVIYDRCSHIRLDESSIGTNESLIAAYKNYYGLYKDRKIYYDGALGDYIRNEEGDYVHLGTKQIIRYADMQRRASQPGVKRTLVSYYHMKNYGN